MVRISPKRSHNKRIFKLLQPVSLSLVLFATSAYAYTSSGAHHQTTSASPAKHAVTATVVPAKPVTTPAAPSNPVTTPVVPTTISPKAVSTPTPQPTVTPAPSSSVTNLTPTTTTPAPTTSTPPPTNTSTTNAASYNSTNWSGYFAANGSYTTVSASWVVPSPSGNGTSTSADATWVGIGGVTSSDLIQIGTDNTVTASGQVHSEAFYELLPAVSQTVTALTVNPGDAINASISETSPNQWLMTIIDTTTGQTYSNTVSYTSSHSSAEWIEEDPSYSNGRLVPFDAFGSVTFTNASTTSNGTSLNLTTANTSPIVLVNRSGTPIATPSATSSNGTSFSVTHN